jgi:hypothetical protein
VMYWRKPRFIINHKMMLAITFGSMQEWQHSSCMSFRFSHKSSVNRCDTQCKWNNLDQIEWCKYRNTIWRATNSLLAIEWADSNGDLSNMARIFASRSSSGDLPVRISSCRY